MRRLRGGRKWSKREREEGKTSDAKTKRTTGDAEQKEEGWSK